MFHKLIIAGHCGNEPTMKYTTDGKDEPADEVPF